MEDDNSGTAAASSSNSLLTDVKIANGAFLYCPYSDSQPPVEESSRVLSLPRKVSLLFTYFIF